ncbi:MULTISPECIES: glutathione S-transferase family protein [Rodentibacter]|uniref:glutathione S-transferase family protein n=1 Tax=Rodentibacter TaxID=1960084 RepID=UPI001CFE77F1|nr:glutathione S-transferase [Rodentibacter sp. JRC1]GJI55685.1 glutathione S-transferase [Rodentibacter sp. JRC1]
MFKLYVNPPKSTWSLRVWILMKQLNIPFEQVNVHYLQDKILQRQHFLQFSPTGKIPVLEHNGMTVWDSLAIIEYLAEIFPQVWAKDKSARAWSRSACAEMHSGFEQLREICDFSPLERLKTPSISTALAQELARLDQLWRQGLSQFGSDFLTGEAFTAVDAFFVPIALRIETYSLQNYFSRQCLDYQQRLLRLKSLPEWLREK